MKERWELLQRYKKKELDKEIGARCHLIHLDRRIISDMAITVVSRKAYCFRSLMVYVVYLSRKL